MAENLATTLELNARDNTRAAFARLDKNLKAVKGNTDAATVSMGNLRGAVLRATSVFAAFTVVALSLRSSIGASRQFGKSMAEVATLIDDAETSLSQYSEVVDRLVMTYGGQFLTTTKALYDTISAGNGTVAASTKILNAANTAAIAGVSDIATSVDVLTTVLNSYGFEANKATFVTDVLFKTVKAGKTTLTELAPVMGQVAATAASMGVSFEEVGAALATATAKGIRTSQAVTGLKATLSNIIKPTKDAEAMAERLGIQFNSAALQAQGFTGFFRGILDAASREGVPANQAMQAFFGSVEGLNTVLALTSNNAELFTKNLMETRNASGATAVAFAKMTKTFDFQWEAFLGKLKVGARNIGNSFTNALLVPITFINKNFEIWLLEFNHFFAQIADVAWWLGDQVTQAFEQWKVLDWVIKKVIEPMEKAWEWLYIQVVGKSYVPDMVIEVTEWFRKLIGTANDVISFFIVPLELAFKGFSHIVSAAVDVINLSLIPLLGVGLPDFGRWIRDALDVPDMVSDAVKDNLDVSKVFMTEGEKAAASLRKTVGDTYGWFAAAGFQEIMFKMLGITLIPLAIRMFKRLTGVFTNYTNTMRANRAVATEAMTANFKTLKDQEKFIKDRTTFNTNYGKQLQKIVNAGGTRSIMAQFFGGEDDWKLLKARSKDALETSKKSIRGLSVDARGRTHQSLISRAVIGNLSDKEIRKRLDKNTKVVNKEAKKAQKFTGKKGLFSNIGNLINPKNLKDGITRIGQYGKSVEEFGRKANAAGIKAELIGRIDTRSGISNLERLKATANTVGGVILQRVAMPIKTLGRAARIAAVDVNKSFSAIQAKATAVRNSFVGRGVMNTIMYGGKGAAGILKGTGMIFGKVRSMSTRAQTGIAGGLMAYVMFGDTLKDAFAAAKKVEDTGNGMIANFKAKALAAIDSMPDTGIAMLAMLGPVGAIAAAGLLAIKHWDKIKMVFNEFIEWARNQDWGEILLNGLGAATDTLLQFGRDTAFWIGKGFDALGEMLLEALMKAKDGIIGFFADINPFAGWFEDTKDMSIRGQMAGGSLSLSEMEFGFNSGGKVQGKGTGTSDSIMAMLSNGEYVINADATSKFLPLLEAINGGELKGFAAGGGINLAQGATLEELFASNKSVTQTKQQVSRTFGNVDFNDARKFLNTLFNLKLSEKDIQGFAPATLEAIKQRMHQLSRSTELLTKDMVQWTEQNNRVTNALSVSSEATAKWSGEIYNLVEPLIVQNEDLAVAIQQVNKKANDLNMFLTGWAKALDVWTEDNINASTLGERAGRMFTGTIDNVVDALVRGDSLRDTMKANIIQWAQQTAGQTIKTFLAEMFSKTNLRSAGSGNIFSSIFNAIFGGAQSKSKGQGVTSLLSDMGSFATGGIPPVNQVSIVGEKGPELFVPGTRGRIHPNQSLRGNMNPPVQINQTMHITEAINPAAFQQELIRNNQVVVGLVDEAMTNFGKPGLFSN